MSSTTNNVDGDSVVLPALMQHGVQSVGWNQSPDLTTHAVIRGNSTYLTPGLPKARFLIRRWQTAGDGVYGIAKIRSPLLTDAATRLGQRQGGGESWPLLRRSFNLLSSSVTHPFSQRFRLLIRSH